MQTTHRVVAAVAATVLAATIGITDAIAADFYKGKRLNVVVGFSPGGGYDAYSRMLARFIGKHVPGNPTVVVQNMPGASSMKALRFVTEVAAQDGTSIVAFNPGLIAQALSQPKKVPIDFRKVRFLGSITSDIRICYAWHATGIKSADDLFTQKEVIFGATEIGSTSYVSSAMLKNILGIKVKHVTGYPGSAEQRLAIERGELMGDCGSWSSIPPEWITSNKAVPLVTFSKAKTDVMPVLPHVIDLAKTKEQKQLINAILAPGEVGRPYAVGPKVPADRLAMLRKAFHDTLNDKDFITEATKAKRDLIGPMTGEEAEATIAEIYETPQSVIDKMADAIK